MLLPKSHEKLFWQKVSFCDFCNPDKERRLYQELLVIIQR
jgi:hypothetical protein